MAKGKIKLEVLKYNALKLRRNYQLPFELVYAITKLTYDSDTMLANYLMAMSEHLLRVKGYYKKYPLAEQEANAQIKQDLIKFNK